MAGQMLGSATARVYVGNLSWEVQWQDLKDHMRGPNQDLNVMHADVMVDATGPAALSVRDCNPADELRAHAASAAPELTSRAGTRRSFQGVCDYPVRIDW